MWKRFIRIVFSRIRQLPHSLDKHSATLNKVTDLYKTQNMQHIGSLMQINSVPVLDSLSLNIQHNFDLLESLSL